MTQRFSHPTTPARSGFTLIEVLIATFVIALGSIGLIALFAGAAAQQRVASQTTASVIVSKNAEAIISPRFGRIDGTLFDGQPNPNDLDRGVWYPVPADDLGNLSINPRASSIQERREAYFLLDRNDETVLFELPMTSQWRQQALGRGRYRADGQGPDGAVFNVSPYAVRPFPVSRVDGAGTASIQVVHNDKPQPGDPQYNYRGEVTSRFVYVNTNYAAGRPTNWPVNAPFSNQGEYALFTQNGGFPGPTGSYILVKRYEEPVTGEPLSFIDQFDITAIVDPTGDAQFQRHLQRIVVPRVVYRSAEVISSGDRVVTVADDAFDAGVRPDVGYSLLFRKLESGGSQIAVFTYFVSGSDRSGEFALAENVGDAPGPFGSDSGSDEWGLRMLADIVLAYDEDREQFYFEASSDEEINALAPGAVILVSGEPEGGSNRLAGADLPVRVVRQVRAPGGGNVFRCYINRVPRAGGKSMLAFRDQTRSLDLWTIRQNVVSTDGSEWSLRPRELRIFNVN
ncbi:MAG: prepilin-type N-terminal cleavage/methylation domain-containing protein [Phycisphaerales bacterium]|nr:prepilin-type N-terminal cleavage/methylation domain-containing protein [bacterium]